MLELSKEQCVPSMSASLDPASKSCSSGMEMIGVVWESAHGTYKYPLPFALLSLLHFLQPLLVFSKNERARFHGCLFFQNFIVASACLGVVLGFLLEKADIHLHVSRSRPELLLSITCGRSVCESCPKSFPLLECVSEMALRSHDEITKMRRITMLWLALPGRGQYESSRLLPGLLLFYILTFNTVVTKRVQWLLHDLLRPKKRDGSLHGDLARLWLQRKISWRHECAATDLRDQKYKLESLCAVLRSCSENHTT